jgi:hypothetical protein
MTASAVFFFDFVLSKAELSMHLHTVGLQKRFNLSIRKPQNRSHKVFFKEPPKVFNDYLVMRKMKVLFLIRWRV